LLLYTDGVFEGRVKGTPNRLGHEKMAELLMADLVENPNWRRSPGFVLDRLIAAVEELNEGPLDDDVALALVTHDPGGAR
jgi:stage II sporulation SpoE-like protein